MAMTIFSSVQAQQSYPTETFKTQSGKDVVITLIKHASLAVTYDNYNIYVDPVLKFGDLTVDYTTLPKADVILITHEHGDHYSPDAIGQLETAQTQILLNGKSQQQFGRGETIANFENRQLGHGIQLESVPAYNITPDHLQFHPKGNGNGYVLTIDGLRIYVAGDTEDIPELADIKNIDVAFLPVNQPYTMTVDQAVHAAQVIQPKVFIPYHYSQTPIEQVKQQLDAAGSGIDVRIRPMQ